VARPGLRHYAAMRVHRVLLAERDPNMADIIIQPIKQLSSICAIASPFAGMALAPALMAGKKSPHWTEIMQPGHLSPPLCDQCGDLARLTPEEREAWSLLPPSLAEFGRKVITSRSPLKLIARIRRM
jgi:hypothetical protein